MNEIAAAFLLALVAGLFTGVGGLLTMFIKKTDKSFLAICLSFSAGVMIYIAFVEMFVHGHAKLYQLHGEDRGLLIATVSFFGGIVLVALIDKLISNEEEAIDSMLADKKLTKKEKVVLKRLGVMAALAIAVQNLSEGLVTFMAAIYDPTLGIALAIAVAIHNIPEGIAVATPIYYATGSKKKAFFYSLVSGLTGPIGAIAGIALVFYSVNGVMLGVAFAVAAGIMVYVSIFQLLPTALKFGSQSRVMTWLFIGMAIMAGALVLL
ncbi:zinc transporter ZupT [Candidatus Saccharibacteria bacterium]|nr:zinc transporter ZupT [Candidatus Saccharibacteria bacterium]